MVPMATMPTKTSPAFTSNQQLDNSQCHAATPLTPLLTVGAAGAVGSGGSRMTVRPVPANVILMCHLLFTPWASTVADFSRQWIANIMNRYVHVLYEFNIINVVTRFFV